jgi:hypothetical protein
MTTVQSIVYGQFTVKMSLERDVYLVELIMGTDNVGEAMQAFDKIVNIMFEIKQLKKGINSGTNNNGAV